MLEGDTRSARLEYARLLTAIRQGRPAVLPVEMSRLIAETSGHPFHSNLYGRWERGDSMPAPNDAGLDAAAQLAGVTVAWMRYGSEGQIPAPPGYEEWLRRKLGLPAPRESEAPANGSHGPPPGVSLRKWERAAKGRRKREG